MHTFTNPSSGKSLFHDTPCLRSSYSALLPFPHLPQTFCHHRDCNIQHQRPYSSINPPSPPQPHPQNTPHKPPSPPNHAHPHPPPLNHHLHPCNNNLLPPSPLPRPIPTPPTTPLLHHLAPTPTPNHNLRPHHPRNMGSRILRAQTQKAPRRTRTQGQERLPRALIPHLLLLRARSRLRKKKPPKRKTEADTETNRQAQTPPRKCKGNVRATKTRPRALGPGRTPHDRDG